MNPATQACLPQKTLAEGATADRVHLPVEGGLIIGSTTISDEPVKDILLNKS